MTPLFIVTERRRGEWIRHFMRMADESFDVYPHRVKQAWDDPQKDTEAYSKEKAGKQKD